MDTAKRGCPGCLLALWKSDRERTDERGNEGRRDRGARSADHGSCTAGGRRNGRAPRSVHGGRAVGVRRHPNGFRRAARAGLGRAGLLRRAGRAPALASASALAGPHRHEGQSLRRRRRGDLSLRRRTSPQAHHARSNRATSTNSKSPSRRSPSAAACGSLAAATLCAHCPTGKPKSRSRRATSAANGRAGFGGRSRKWSATCSTATSWARCDGRSKPGEAPTCLSSCHRTG